METHMIVRLVLGLVVTAVALAIAGRRIFFLYCMTATDHPSPGRLDGWPKRLATLQTPSVTAQPAGPPPSDQAPARAPEAHGPTPGQGPVHSTGSPGDATEGQGPGSPFDPDPSSVTPAARKPDERSCPCQ